MRRGSPDGAHGSRLKWRLFWDGKPRTDYLKPADRNGKDYRVAMELVGWPKSKKTLLKQRVVAPKRGGRPRSGQPCFGVR